MRWFLVSGCVGLVVALSLATLAGSLQLNPRLLLVLWPISVIGLAEPSGLTDKIIFGALEFGGNFVLYGVIGILIAICLPRATGRSLNAR
jgi:hypothetical protein